MQSKPASAAVVAEHTNNQQPSGQSNPNANGLEPAKPAVSSETATRCMSCEDKSGPLGSMPADTTPSQAVAAGEGTS